MAYTLSLSCRLLSLSLLFFITSSCQHHEASISSTLIGFGPNPRPSLLKSEVKDSPQVKMATVHFNSSWNNAKKREALRTPQNGFEVKIAMMRALDELENDNFDSAIDYFRSMLATDFLTDSGRMNIYWYTAQAAQASEDWGQVRDSYGSYLMASSLLPKDFIDAEITQRLAIARAVLNAHEVAKHDDFGRAPEKAIPIEDLQETELLIETLTCGPEGKARFTHFEEQSPILEKVHLMQRQIQCSDGGGVLSLWFDLSEIQKRSRADVARR